jgi:hypothetical protein
MIDRLAIYGIIIVPAVYATLFFLTRGHAKARRLAIGVVISTLVALLFAPGICTALWHVRHGNHIAFKGKIIHVPTRWIVMEDVFNGPAAKELEFVKPPLLIFSRRQGSISIIPPMISGGASGEDRSKTWQSLYWTYLSGTRDTVSGPIQIEQGSQHATCMLSVNNAAPNQTSAACLFLGDNWIAEFFGDSKDLETFFDVVKSVKKS